MFCLKEDWPITKGGGGGGVKAAMYGSPFNYRLTLLYGAEPASKLSGGAFAAQG